jgi:hypothetical protein
MRGQGAIEIADQVVGCSIPIDSLTSPAVTRNRPRSGSGTSQRVVVAGRRGGLLRE